MTVKTFNVLVLGETQSGKSTLLEALKLYADPTYKIDKSRIGSGNVSLTTEVRQESIKTRLPEYLVKKVDRPQPSEVQPKAQQHPVAYDVFITKDKDTYEDELNARREYQPPVQGNPWSSEELTFNIIDTPGLNDTKDQDEHHVFKIISELGGQSLDLVLVTVSRGAFTQGLQQVLRSYMDLFPQLGDIMAFVHTRVDYLELHPDMTNFQSYMKEKVATLSAIMGRSSFPHFWIDCDFETTKPVRKCITNNTLRRILRLAVENKSVIMLRSKTLNKTSKMKEIDRIIKNQVRAVIQAIEKTLEFNDKDEGVLLQGVYIRATEINELQAKINILQDLQKSYQIDELGLLHEERVDDIQRPLAMGVSCPARYAGEHTIDDAVVWCENFMFCGLDGEQSSGSWEGTFKKKTQGYNGYYHVKLYAKKSSRFKAEIDVIATEIADLEVQLQRRVNESDLPPKEALSKIQSFVDAHNRHMEVIRLASADTLHHDLFVELVNARAFAGPTSESSERVAAVYRASAHTRFLNVNKPLPSPQARFAWTPQMHTTTPARSNAVDYTTVEGQMHQMLTAKDLPPLRYLSPLRHQQTPSQYQQIPLQHQQTSLQQQQTPSQYQNIPSQYQQAPLQHQQTPSQQQQTPSQQQQTPLQHQQIPSQYQQIPLQHQQTPLQHQQTPRLQPQAVSRNLLPLPPRVGAIIGSTTPPVDHKVDQPKVVSSDELPAHEKDSRVDRSEEYWEKTIV